MRVRDIGTGLDIIDPARDPNLHEVAPFDDDTLAELAAEMAMPAEVLNQQSSGFKRTISDAMKRAVQACS